MSYRFTEQHDTKEKYMAQESRHMTNEADIGSGKRTPGQQDIDRAVEDVNVPLPQVGAPRDGSHLTQGLEEQAYYQREGFHQDKLPGRILQHGDHIARIVAVKQPDDTFEAQVYVRLAREPEVAETYIPVGHYGSEAAAMEAAEERAQRAFDEHEF